MHCPYCAEQIEEGIRKCPLCEELLGDRITVPPPPPVIPIPVSEEDSQEMVDLANANSKATLALVFGILSLPGILCCVGIIFGGIGIFLGVSSNMIYRRYHQSPNGKATGGIILGTISIVLMILSTLINIFS